MMPLMLPLHAAAPLRRADILLRPLRRYDSARLKEKEQIHYSRVITRFTRHAASVFAMLLHVAARHIA